MNNNAWFKKEIPLQTVIGFGGGATGFGAHSSSAISSKYVDEVFSTYVYTGNESARSFDNGINLSAKGGLVWIKNRSAEANHAVFDTVRGATKEVQFDYNVAETTIATSLTAFNNNGFSIGADTGNRYNQAATNYSSWSFRKAKGFCDIVTFTGNGSVRTISHGLGSIPGLILIKDLSAQNSWFTYHRDLGPSGYVMFNHSNAVSTTQSWFMNDTAPTATEFTVGTGGNVNQSGNEFIVYLFAGGERDAATARSVEFVAADPDYLVTNSSSDYTFGTGDYTVEAWIKPGDHSSSGGMIVDWRNDADQFYDDAGIYIYQDTVRLWEGGDRITSSPIPQGSWSHVALVRNSGTETLYVNGISQGTYSSSYNFDEDKIYIATNGANPGGGNNYNGKISNVRVVKGTAVYTSSFVPSTDPLTSITNTVLLCCNNSSVTGTTTGTVTSSGSPTASTDSPFDDSEGFKFGADEDKGIIKTGSYTGNGSSTGPVIHLGWEPQWLIIKNTSSSGSGWMMYDAMRGWFNEAEDDRYIMANEANAETTFDLGHPTATGFEITTSNSSFNASGDTYIYWTIRRPDGYVAKPVSAGTGAFAMDTGNGSASIPTFDSGFPVDFALLKRPAATSNFLAQSRLSGDNYLLTNSTQAETAHTAFISWDNNVGWAKSWDNLRFSWMWKRGQGFDTVAYAGNGTAGREIPHNLSQTPEMIWVKNRSLTQEWVCYHKGLNGGTTPWEYYIYLSGTGQQVDDTQFWNDTAPTSTHVTTGGSTENNHSGSDHLMMLFASANDEEGNPISKVGYYDGQNSELTITTGFQPRFVILKRVNYAYAVDWHVLDTLRGWGAGNDEYLALQSSQAQASHDFGAPTSTGFTLTSAPEYNGAGGQYIYYAHA